jgi:hypothetical protein
MGVSIILIHHFLDQFDSLPLPGVVFPAIVERLDLHLKGSFIVILVLLGCVSCGITPLIMWLATVKNYPKGLDGEGVTLRSGARVPWSSLTGKKKMILRRGGRKSVIGVVLTFGSTKVNIAPRVLAEETQVLPFLSRVLREDFTTP